MLFPLPPSKSRAGWPYPYPGSTTAIHRAPWLSCAPIRVGSGFTARPLHFDRFRVTVQARSFPVSATTVIRSHRLQFSDSIREVDFGHVLTLLYLSSLSERPIGYGSSIATTGSIVRKSTPMTLRLKKGSVDSTCAVRTRYCLGRSGSGGTVKRQVPSMTLIPGPATAS